MCLRPADLVDTRKFLSKGLLPRVARTKRIDKAERATFLARAIVGCDEHDRIRQHGGPLEEVDEASEVAVRMVEHRRIGRLKTREEALLVGAVALPQPHSGVARRQSSPLWHDPHRLLPREPAITLGVPAVSEGFVVALYDVDRRLMRRMACARREPKKPGRLGLLRSMVG